MLYYQRFKTRPKGVNRKALDSLVLVASRRWACLDAVAGAFLVVSDVCEWDARAALKNPSAIFRGLDLSVGKKMADLATLPKVSGWTGHTVNSK